MTIIELINSFRKERTDFTSNAFFNTQQILDFTKDNSVEIWVCDKSVIFVMDHSSFYKVYFYSTSTEAIKKLYAENVKKLKKSKPVIIDSVYKEGNIPKYSGLLGGIGFQLYSRYKRMICKKHLDFVDVPTPEITIRLAKINEVEYIYKLLYDNFDPYGDHLPSILDVEKAIKNLEISVVEFDNEIIGFSFFEEKGSNLIYFRALYVDSRFRGKGVSTALIVDKFNQYQSSVNFMLWVIENNIPAVKNHRKFGFEFDGLISDVYIDKNYLGE